MTRPDATVAITTLGCARNEVDSDQLAGLLRGAGYRLVTDPDGADVVLVNTCTFITPATQESVDTVLAACDLKERGTRAVVVVGCMAERYRTELADAVPEADAIVGFGAYPRLPGILDEVLAGRDLPAFVGREGEAATTTAAGGSRRGYLPQDDLDRIPRSGPRFPVRAGATRPWSYLKIASGCDRACTFCAIPSWRGSFRSRPLAEIVTEARWLVDAGARELVLVSENTTSWGRDLDGGSRTMQPRLLEELAAVDGLERIRLMYLQPAELLPELLDAMAEIDAVASYYDLSLQHASAPVLEAMARTGSPRRFAELVASIRARDPAAVFRSNFIVGFPGETTADVEELARFLEEARLDWVGLFAFSPQEGTVAPRLPDQVEEEVAQRRLRELTDLQEVIADGAARRFVGQRLEVTVEQRRHGATLGRSYREAPETDGEIRLVLPDRVDGARQPAGRAVELPVGRTVDAEVVAADGVDLVAVPELPARIPVAGERRRLPLVSEGTPGAGG